MAFRSARLVGADFMGMEQRSIRRCLYICIPGFSPGISYGIGGACVLDAVVWFVVWKSRNPVLE